MEKILKIIKELKEKKVLKEPIKKILKKYGLYDKYVPFKEIYFETK